MGECFYCEKEVGYYDGYEGDLNIHGSCQTEHDNRKADHRCVFCEDDLGDIKDIAHERCRVAGVYSGYG